MDQQTIATTFLGMIIAGNVQEAFDHYTSDDFVHHNQHTKPGKEELIKGMEGSHENFPHKIYTILNVSEEDDKVSVYAFLKMNDEHEGIHVTHTLRFENDKIAEMWDKTEQIPRDL